jgi:hypothetical protein
MNYEQKRFVVPLPGPSEKVMDLESVARKAWAYAWILYYPELTEPQEVVDAEGEEPG